MYCVLPINSTHKPQVRTGNINKEKALLSPDTILIIFNTEYICGFVEASLSTFRVCYTQRCASDWRCTAILYTVSVLCGQWIQLQK